MHAKDTLALAGFGALTAGAAALGAKATDDALYPLSVNLKKAPFQPPRGAFGPLWTALYGLVAVAGFRLFRAKRGRRRTVALALWGTQLVASAAWSKLFFGKHRGKAALADVAVLEGLAVGSILAAFEVDAPAATMLTPAAAWHVFASVLNEEVLRRNPLSEFAALP
jgi:tryptophan-rich sensory protein